MNTVEKKKYYITTAITYTSAKPHIGNTYEIVLTDALARFKRFQGYDVFFQTGTDEHGQKIEDKALKASISPQKYVDQIASVVKSNFDLMNTTYDKFIRTSDDEHKVIVQKIFKKLFDQQDIYKGNYVGMYCKPCESFLTDSQLVDGKCPECGGVVEKTEEEAYFFNLQKYAGRLLKHIEDNPDFIQPESRKNEMINNFLKPGLQDLCVSRSSFDWGIHVDFDPKHVVYVWIDALSNYITSLGYDVDGNHGDMFKKYWPADLHVIGKDILRFHTIYWPIMLMALDVELPKHIFGHPWILVGDGKMSKSKNNAIYADDLVEVFGVDAVRYFVLHEMPFAQDGTITWDLVVERNNSDLANVIGNLVSRTIAMQNKYFRGVISNPMEANTSDAPLIEQAIESVNIVCQKMDEFKVKEALDTILQLFKRCNKYIDESTPWILGKDDTHKDRLATILYNLLECIRIGTVLLQSFLPKSAEKILDTLSTSKRDIESVKSFGQLECGHTVDCTANKLFERIDEEELNKQLNAEEKIEDSAHIAFEDFAKVKYVVGTILEANKHPKADRLLIEKIDIGNKCIQVVSGIAQAYQCQELIGHKVIVVTNLAPVKLRGVNSEGMILCAGKDKDMKIVTCDDSMANGSIVA